MNELAQISQSTVFVRVASQQRLFEQGQTAKDFFNQCLQHHLLNFDPLGLEPIRFISQQKLFLHVSSL
jgi:hypothetical protein